MGFIAFILFLFLFLAVMGLSIIGNLFRAIFGIGKRPASNSRPHHTSGSSAGNRHETSAAQKKKVFDKADGEYVDFEEIKD